MHSTLSYERAPMSVVDTALVHHHLAFHNSHGLVLCKLEDARAVSEKPSVCLRLTVWSIISRETTTLLCCPPLQYHLTNTYHHILNDQHYIRGGWTHILQCDYALKIIASFTFLLQKPTIVRA